MKDFFSTKEVARIFGIRPDILQKAVWLEKIPQPEKIANRFFWRLPDIEAAAWALKMYNKFEAWKKGIFSNE